MGKIEKSKYDEYKKVYLVRCEQYCKIGISTDTNYRLTSNEAFNPFELILVAESHFMPPPDAYQLEYYLHYIFQDYRHRGEWFEFDKNITNRLIKFIYCPQQNIYEFIRFEKENGIYNCLVLPNGKPHPRIIFDYEKKNQQWELENSNKKKKVQSWQLDFIWKGNRRIYYD